MVRARMDRCVYFVQADPQLGVNREGSTRRAEKYYDMRN